MIRHVSLRVWSVVTVLLLAVITTVGLISAPGAQAGLSVQQNQVVNAVPASYTPNLDGGIVFAIAQVGSWIVAGGTFTTATPHGSSTATSVNGIVAFDQSTGALDTGFAPTLDGPVNSVIPGPTPGTVYVGGQFSTVNGVKSKGVTLLNLSDGSIVSGFKPPALNGIVEAMRLSGGRLYITGTFTLTGSVTHDGLATLNPTTGALDPFMNIQLTGHHNYNGSGANGPVGGRAMDVSPDGTRAIVLGDFKDANGDLHDQIVMIDLTGSSATIDPNWNTNEFTGACASGAFDTYVEDVDFSPDGSYFAIATTGGGGISQNTDGTRSLCDTRDPLVDDRHRHRRAADLDRLHRQRHLLVGGRDWHGHLPRRAPALGQQPQRLGLRRRGRHPAARPGRGRPGQRHAAGLEPGPQPAGRRGLRPAGHPAGPVRGQRHQLHR